MKKTFALAIAVMMLCACAFSVSAAETTLPDSDGTGWWVGHTDGVEVTEEGVEITFTNTTYETATGNWNGPLFVAYTSDNAKVGGENYVEYWVSRGDVWGWGNAAYYGVTLGGAEGEGVNPAWPAHMETAGITFTSSFSDSWGSWEQYQTALKAGAEGKITANIADGKLTATMEIAGASGTVVAPVDTSKPVYISLFAELATLTNIKVITPDPVCEHTNTELKDAKEATCTEAGFTGNTVCADCGEVIAAGEEIAVLEHTYVDGVCTACGEQDPNYVAPGCQHTNTKVEGAVEATCEEKGFTGNTVCADCGEKIADGEEIAALGHTYGDADKCTVCGNPKTFDVFGIVVAVMAASGTALVALKKKED